MVFKGSEIGGLVDVGIVFMWMKVLRVVFGFMFQGIKMDKLVRWM